MMKSVAKDMGISTRKLARDTLAARALVETKPRNRVIDQNDDKAVRRNSDSVAEKYGTFKFDKAANEWARISRDAMRNDKAAIAARKICRAIPNDKAALVSTRRGYEIVTVSRVERAANVATIEKQLARAIEAEAEAMEKRADRVAVAEKRTNLNRTPKADKARANRASAVADRHSARVRKLRHKLNAAKSQKSAANLVAIRVADIRVSLRPQSMANRTALAVLELPTRKDVNPIREYPRIRKVTGTSAIGAIGSPEAELLRAEAEAEAEALAAIEAEARAEKRAELTAKINAEIAEAERLAAENRRIEYNARRALAAKIRRQNEKKYGKPRKMK